MLNDESIKKKRMNILQLCKYYPPVLGGIELVEKTITRAHADLGDKVVIVAFSDAQGQFQGEFKEDVILIKQDVFFKSAPLNFRFTFNFKKLLIENKIERIYVHLPNPFMHEVLKYSKSYLKKMNIDVVAVYHSDIVNQKFLGSVYNYYFMMWKNLYTHWICSSEKLWFSSPILKKINTKKQRVIPFCTEGILNFNKRDKFHGNLLAVGRLVPYKGFDFLIEAIKKTNYKLNIIGDGPEYEKLLKIADSHPNIILHRRLEENAKKQLFDKSDLLIMSSINRAEAYGMIIVEAFESGLPVVASNIDSGVTFLVQHEKTGLVFETKNENMLIQSIERLEKDSQLYQALSSNGRNFFEEELSYNRFKDRIHKL